MLATVVVIVVNFLAATGNINGVLPNEISNKYPTVITPAAWAFTIWILIYAGLFGFSIYQLLPTKLSKFAPMRMPYIVSCVLNCTWIVFWHHFHTGICAVVIVLLLGSLLWVNLNLSSADSFLESTLTKGVFGIYAGWVTVATLVNIVVYLSSAGADFGHVTWNVIGIVCLAFAGLAAVARDAGHRFLRGDGRRMAVAGGYDGQLVRRRGRGRRAG